MMDISDQGSSTMGVYSTAFIPGFELEGPGVEVPGGEKCTSIGILLWWLLKLQK